MFKNYLKIAFRNLIRQKGYSFINITGLAIGIASCLLIFLYVQDELSYDRYNEKADRIYRVCIHGIVGSNEFNQTVTAAPMAQALVNDYPEVEAATRFWNFGYPVLRYKDKVFSEERFFSADSNIFDVFTIPFIEGNPKTALNKPNTLVLTQSMARKYFGDEDPMGKVLNADNRRDYIVTGVVRDVPHNSHFHFDFLASLSTYEVSRSTRWLNNNYLTYIVLRKGISPKLLEKKFPAMVRKYVGPQVQEALGISLDQMAANGNLYEFYLQPLTDIHLHSHLSFEIEPNGDATYVLIFSIIAIGILLIACINFMNLATARSANRAREVGIRKTLGSNRLQLIRQFLAETIFTSFFAIFFALIFVEMLLPYFNNLAGKNISMHFFDNILVIPALVGLAVFVGIMAGSYPAFFLASFRPVQVLKGNVKSGNKNPWLRSGLVIFQFAISIILIIGTFIVYNQMQYIQNKNLGFNKEQVVVIEKTDDIGTQIKPFKQELLQNSNVISVSNSSTLPGKDFGSNVHKVANTSGEETHLLWTLFSDRNFAETYQIKMAEGRFFSPERKTDSMAVVLNQTAVKVLGLTDPIGKDLVQIGSTPERSVTFKIIGVTKDFNFQSLHQKIRPLVMKSYGSRGFGRYTSVRIAPGHIKETLAYLEKTWHKFAGAQAFEYVFFDQDFAKIYQSEQRTSQILSVFSILAIFIACLGLFGLASFVTEQRTKEIGIRKSLGASVANITLLLSKEFARWMVLANLVAWPVAFFIMKDWLNNFAYRIDLSIFTFLSATLIAILIALFTVSYQTIKASLTNPVDALRYE